MITKITVKNWQRHKKLELDLGRVTTIIGPTNAGKSALLRALAWVAVGNIAGFVPKAKKMLRHGTKRTTVSMEIGKHKISRSKGDVNNYVVNGTKLKAFGQRIPDEVSQIFNVNDLNFQKQVGLPFWFAESPGQLSKAMNKIVDLSVIDDTLKNLGRMMSKSKAKHEALSDELKVTREKRSLLSDIAEIDEFLQSVERYEKLAKTHAIRARILHELVSEGTTAQQTLDERSLQLLALTSVLHLGTAWNKVREERQALTHLVSTAGHHARAIEGRIAMPAELEELASQIKKLNPVKLEELIEEGTHHSNTLAHRQQRIRELTRELSKYKECPLCERKL